MHPETDDQRAERLLRIGLDMAVRIREEPPDAVVREMHGLDHGELRDLALLMAACVDVGRPVSEVVWWSEITETPRKKPGPPKGRQLRPCGSHAAFERHRVHDEPLDIACELSERRRNAERDMLRRSGSRIVHSLSTAGLADDDLGNEGLAA